MLILRYKAKNSERRKQTVKSRKSKAILISVKNEALKLNRTHKSCEEDNRSAII